jgi:hypothetical protein
VAGGPVIVLTYAHSGSELMRSLLGGQPELACTTGTGLVPLCEQAALTWRQAEGRDSAVLSSLAAASISALANSVITAILATTGKRRWCEIATAPPAYAETFLRLYPGTRFLCLHRACPDVICAGVQASPWGLTAPGVRPFAAAYPGNSVAALAAYWAACTEPLLEFEQSHRGACHRIKYEELARGCGATAEGIAEFLGLSQAEPGLLGPEDLVRPQAPGRAAPIPLGQLPPVLHGQVDGLLDRLGYPSLALPEPNVASRLG